MKYGVHSSESVESILNRKNNEIEKCGFMMWGYGGVLCHPVKQLRPFLQKCISKNEKVYLLLSQTKSEHHSLSPPLTTYSYTGQNWLTLPHGVEIRGSKYAVICKNLYPCDFSLNFENYNVAIGPSEGKKLSDYVRGRVDKACGIYTHNCMNNTPLLVHISWFSEIEDAVFVGYQT